MNNFDSFDFLSPSPIKTRDKPQMIVQPLFFFFRFSFCCC